jgi:hypothetical protein
VTKPTVADKVTDLDLPEVTPAQFAICGEVEHCAIA